MAPVFSKLYTVLATIILTSWTITALGLTALSVLNANKTLIQSIASISLFSFLFCRLLVVFRPIGTGLSQNGTIAHLIATADHGSRKGALMLFGLCCTWLYELLSMGVLLLFMTFFGGVMATAIYQGSAVRDGAATENSAEEVNALAEVNEFKEKAGVDPAEIFKLIPPKALIYFVVLLWLNFLSLGLYVLGHAAKSLVTVLSSPSAVLDVSISGSPAAPIKETANEGRKDAATQ